MKFLWEAVSHLPGDKRTREDFQKIIVPVMCNGYDKSWEDDDVSSIFDEIKDVAEKKASLYDKNYLAKVMDKSLNFKNKEDEKMD